MASTFFPSLKFINSITQGTETIVSYASAHDFTIGQIVSFRVSEPFGMVEMNNIQARIDSTTSNSITVPIDSRNFTSYTTPAAADVGSKPALTVPVATGVLDTTIPATYQLNNAFDNKPPTEV